MSSKSLELPRGVLVAIAAIVAVVLTWRVVVAGVDAMRVRSDGIGPGVTTTPLETRDPEAIWRKNLARNPADYIALLNLALQFERDGKQEAARAAASQVLRLAPTDQVALTQTGNLFLRSGDEVSALVIVRRLLELYPAVRQTIWPVFAAALDSARHGEFFTRAAQDNVIWWREFFGYACEKATLASLQGVFNTRVSAGVATTDERRCIVSRLQREGKWTTAHQFWLNSLPADQRQRVGFVFNGGFETPLSNLGFDWLVSGQDGVVVNTEVAEGASGRRALHVTFVNKRYTGEPVYQYLLLYPGKYRLEGRGRAEGLNTWLGVQWGLYCHGATSSVGRQLARSDPVLGSSDWADFQHDFAVSKDCPVQVLRLELANPQRDAKSGGNVAVRLRGGVWFDDLRVRILD